jgi:hypothetical protein
MPKQFILRIDLSELDPHFERYAARHGLDAEKTHVQAIALAENLYLGRAIRLPARDQILLANDELRGHVYSMVSE